MLSLAEDRKIYNDLIEYAGGKWKNVESVSQLVLAIGKYFLGHPYASHTLEAEGEESLVINLREFDCFTFVENVVVLATLIKERKYSLDDYATLLARSRYRHGIVEGYSSRLHYFSDWLSDNEKKGIVKDFTSEMEGKRFLKNIHYMTSHRDTYPVLSSTEIYEEMRTVERNLSERQFCYIPKEEFKQYEVAIEEGDIIAMTTSVEGLDIVHVGIAVCVERGIHLLHASEVEKRVVVSDTTLHQYLYSRHALTGIMVGRVR